MLAYNRIFHLISVNLAISVINYENVTDSQNSLVVTSKDKITGPKWSPNETMPKLSSPKRRTNSVIYCGFHENVQMQFIHFLSEEVKYYICGRCICSYTVQHISVVLLKFRALQHRKHVTTALLHIMVYSG